MMKTIKIMLLGCLASVFSVPVLASSAGGVEPGAGCEGLLGGSFSKMTGAPYSGTGNLAFDTATMTASFEGTVDQFGGSGGQMNTTVANTIPGVTSVADFEALSAQDMRGFCIQNVTGGSSEFAEVLAARQLTFGLNNTATVEVIVVPLLLQQ